VDRLNHGVTELDVDPSVVDAFFHEGSAAPPDTTSLHPNVCVLLRDRLAPNHTALGRYDAAKERIVPLRVSREF